MKREKQKGQRHWVPVVMAVKVGAGNVWARVKAEQWLYESSKVLQGSGECPPLSKEEARTHAHRVRTLSEKEQADLCTHTKAHSPKNKHENG